MPCEAAPVVGSKYWIWIRHAPWGPLQESQGVRLNGLGDRVVQVGRRANQARSHPHADSLPDGLLERGLDEEQHG